MLSLRLFAVGETQAADMRMGHWCAAQHSRASLAFPERVTGVRGALPR